MKDVIPDKKAGTPSRNPLGLCWEPSGDYLSKSNITRFMRKHQIKDYPELVRKSTADIEWFWDAALKDLGVEWYQPYSKILDQSKGFPWAEWFIDGQLNIVHNCIDRHIPNRASQIAFIWEGDSGEVKKISYAELNQQVCRVANALKSLGIKKGDTVGIYMPMIPEIIAAFFGCLKIGAVAIPIFSGFGSSALAVRLNDAETKVLFTADGGFRRGKVIPIKKEADIALEKIPTIQKVIVVKRANNDVPMRKDRDIFWDQIVDQQSDQCPTEKLAAEDHSLIIYTSGTTGKPKGILHTCGGYLTGVYATTKYVFDLKDNDTFWCTADCGWITGHSYITYGPMANGATQVM
ncbi:MAG: AMP-binding protein, partial [Planctomycetes bacterium]|nr:AMP-binding protein [Planctomycetota bacterium]